MMALEKVTIRIQLGFMYTSVSVPAAMKSPGKMRADSRNIEVGAVSLNFHVLRLLVVSILLKENKAGLQ